MLSDELISRIGGALDAMPPRRMSHQELVLLLTQIEAKIRAAQERGATYAEIAEQISASGYPITEKRLRTGVQRFRKSTGIVKSGKRHASTTEAKRRERS